jgi:hypothetical protein
MAGGIVVDTKELLTGLVTIAAVECKGSDGDMTGLQEIKINIGFREPYAVIAGPHYKVYRYITLIAILIVEINRIVILFKIAAVECRRSDGDGTGLQSVLAEAGC